MRDSSGEGFTVLDGVALVAGAAVASVHARNAFGDALLGPGWVVTFGVFIGIGITAAGPFLHLLRRFVRRSTGYPRAGDWLWTLLGTPWLVSALVDSAPSRGGASPPGETTWSGVVLLSGIFAASLYAVAVVWKTWVAVDPDRADLVFQGPWTNRVGLVLAIAWPIQCGLGLVVLG